MFEKEYIWIIITLCWFSVMIHDIVLRGYFIGGGATNGRKGQSHNG